MMSVPSAVILTLIAFVGGLFIGHVTARREGGGAEVAEADGTREGAGGGDHGPTIDDEVDRLRVDVSDEMPQRGPDDALVTIAMFSDFQCPFCGRVEPTVTRIREQYGDRVRVVWRNNPLPFHDNAMPAAEAAAEAYAQGGDTKFWQMHDTMMEHQTELDRAHLEQYAQQIGLDMTRFRAALDNHTHQAAIQADVAAAARVGARGTPAFFINGRNLMGAQPFEQFQTIIDDEIHRAEAQVAHGTPRAQLYAALMRGASASAPEEAAPSAAPTKAPPRPQPDPNAVYRVPVTADQPVRGRADALVTMVVFSDFQCPFCSRVEPTVTQLIEQYGNDLRVVWRNNPLPFHQNAGPAAELSVEAFVQQGSEGFWRMHDTLFEHQSELDRAHLEGYAEAQGLNMTAVRNCLDNNTHQAAITADQDLARQLGASGTPSFFINGRNLRGAQPIEAFRTAIDAARTEAQARVAAGTARGAVYEALTANGATSPVMLPAPAGAAPDAPPGEDPNRVYTIPIPAATAAPSRGPASAPVTIQVFSDFQCPFCSRVEPTVTQFMERYQGRVRLIWRNYPLPFHQNATPAAEAASEVFHQRGAEAFWSYHDALFENQSDLSRATLERLAQAVPGINMTAFRAALDNHTHQAEIQADMDAVRTAGAEIGTPSFFVNGRLVQGAQPLEAFTAAIDRALAEHH